MTPLYVDTSRGALVVSPVSAQRCLPPVLTLGDTVAITLAFLQRNPQPLNTGQPLYLYVDQSSSGISLAIGSAGPLPTAGTFTLTWSGSTTAALPFNASQYDVAAALNLLSSVIANGGVSVQGNIGGPFTVEFLLPAVRAAFTADVTNLYPVSTAAIAVNIAGTTTVPGRQTISFSQAPALVLNTWTPQSAAAIAVTSLQANVIQRVAIPAGTYGGIFTLTINGLTTPAIPFNAQFDLVQSVVNTLLGITTATVVSGQNYWDITIPANTFAFTGTAAGLMIPLTLTGSLALTSPALVNLLNGESPADVPFTISATSPSQQTLYSGALTLNAAGT